MGDDKILEEEDSETWVDITGCFKEACASLAEGELYCEEKFGLVEAMTAIEIMDPKMDSTAALFRLGREILTFDDGIQNGLVKIDNFSVEELVGIMDETFATIVTWLDGQNILQTVFTNLYLHDHSKIKDDTLRAFVILALKFINWTITHTNSSCVCYEEDFVGVSTLKFDLANEISYSEAIANAKTIEQNIKDQNVVARLTCFRLLLLCLTTCGNYSSFSQCERDMEVLTKSFVGLKEKLNVIKSSLDLGIKSVEEEVKDPSAARFDYPTIMGFDPLANQHLLPPTLPRAPVIKTRLEAMEFLEKLVDDLQILLTQPDFSYEPWDFLDFLTSFTAREPNVLVRLIGRNMLSNIVNNAGENFATGSQGKEVNEAAGIVPHLCQTFLNIHDFTPKALQLMPPETRAGLQVFLTNLSCTLVAYVQLHYLNLSRQRDKIGKLLEQMFMVTEQAETCDNLLANLAAASPNASPAAEKPRLELLTTYLTTCMEMRYVMLGFQLGIYSSHEYRFVFAGLAEHFLRYYVAFSENALAIVMMPTSKNNKNKTNKKTSVVPPPSAQYIEDLLRQSQSYYSLCMAYFFLSHGLILDGRIQTPKQSKYDDEGRRYFYRFAPFANVSRPPFFSYETYHRVFEQVTFSQSYFKRKKNELV